MHHDLSAVLLGLSGEVVAFQEGLVWSPLLLPPYHGAAPNKAPEPDVTCPDACRCGPCRQVAPHLSNIARKYRDKGLKVIGLSLDDISPSLHQFVASQGDKMGYTVRSLPCLPFMVPSRCLRALPDMLLYTYLFPDLSCMYVPQMSVPCNIEAIYTRGQQQLL